MLELNDIWYSYAPRDNVDTQQPADDAVGTHWVLRGAHLCLARGERVAILGPNGSGKSTLLRCAATQIAPARGSLTLDGRQVVTQADGERLRRCVGVVGQDPDNQIVSSLVFDEVAFGPCNIARTPAEVVADVEEALAACDLSGFEQRDVATLSGGQRQRLALAGVVAMHPSYLLLDEPCSMLDPQSRWHIAAVVNRLAQAGTGIAHVTHELAEVIAYDRVMIVEAGCIVWEGRPYELLFDEGLLERSCCLVSRWLRCARELLRAGLLGCDAPLDDPLRCAELVRAQGACALQAARALLKDVGEAPVAAPMANGDNALRAEGVSYTYEGAAEQAIRNLCATVRPGEVLLVAGQTGSGKSTFAQLMAGLREPQEGSVLLAHKPVYAGSVGYAFQRAEDQLFAESVREDVAFGPRNLGRSKAQAYRDAEDALELVGLDPQRWGDASPFALSGGQMRRVALAGVMAMRTPYVVLDEPTVGLDARGCRDLAALLDRLRGDGVGVVVVSHDIERVAELASHVLLLADGQSVWCGPVDAVYQQSKALERASLGVPAFAAFARELGVVKHGGR